MGAEFVIGVDLNAKHAYERPENILDVIINSFHFTLNAAAKLQSAQADLLIQPDLSEFNRTSTRQIEELMEQGYSEAMNVLKNDFENGKEKPWWDRLF